MVRLQRVLAAAGVAARRACEQLIEEGHVSVNGKVVRTLPAFVDPENDRITVDGRPISRQPSRKIYLMVNKPARVLTTTADDPQIGRTTVLDLINHPSNARLVPVGRLDYDTMGLVLLTNDGELVNRLTHPRYGIPKTYHASIKGILDDTGVAMLQGKINRLQRKDDRHAGRVAPSSGQRVELSIVDRSQGSTLLSITLREGRTGSLTKMLSSAGAPVRSLERVAIGPLELSGLPRAGWRELDRREIRALKNAARGISQKEPGTGRPSTPDNGRARRPQSPGSDRPGARPNSRPGGRPGARPGSRGPNRPGPRDDRRPSRRRPSARRP